MAAALRWPAATGWFEGVWALAIVPVALSSALAGAARLLGEKESAANLWRQIALPMAVVIAAGHMSKGLAKFVPWAPFLPGAFDDAVGLDTANLISAKALQPPAVAWPSSRRRAVPGVGPGETSVRAARKWIGAPHGGRTLARVCSDRRARLDVLPRFSSVGWLSDRSHLA
jgi:hypothetical protein